MINKLPEFAEIRYKDRVALIDPKNKVCLGVSRKIADNLESENVYNVLYPIWKEQVAFQKEVESLHEKINTAYLLVTQQCNMNCSFCAIEASSDGHFDQEITIEDIERKIVPFFQECCPHKVIVTGGEPLIKDSICEIIEVLHEGVKCPIVLQSNGLALQSDIVDRIKGKIAQIDFSTGHMFESERKEKMLREHIEICQDANINVVLSFMYENTTNREDLFKIIDIVAKYDTNLLIKFVTPVGRAKEHTVLLADLNKMEIYLDIAKYIYEKKYRGKLLSDIIGQRIQVKSACGGYGKVMAIHPTGEIYMCQSLMKDDYKIGNILTDSPKAVVNLLEKKMQTEKIKRTFCVEYKENCVACEYKYLCAGKCAAYSAGKGDECYLEKSMINYQLFCRNDSSPEDNLKKYILFFEEAIKGYRENRV